VTDEDWEQALYDQLLTIRGAGFGTVRYRMSADTFERLSEASYRVDVLGRFDDVAIEVNDEAGDAVELHIAAMPAPRKPNLGHSIKVR
jgi:hypothetical protein